MSRSRFSTVRIVRTDFGLKYERKESDGTSRSRFANCYKADPATKRGRIRSTVFAGWSAA